MSHFIFAEIVIANDEIDPGTVSVITEIAVVTEPDDPGEFGG